MKYLSLFSGIGGFEAGFPKNFECVGFSEINKNAINTYKYHYKNHNELGNIKNVSNESIPEHDLLCGGFPCQSFSNIGKKRGFNDKRGSLFFEIIRILLYKQPKYFILENVSNILYIENGRVFSKIINELYSSGYNVQWYLFSLKEFGLPQIRKRVYFIGHNRKKTTTKFLFKSNPNFFISNSREKESYESNKYITSLTFSMKNNVKNTFFPAEQTFIKDEHGIRFLSINECEIIQGFEKDYTKYRIEKDIIVENNLSDRYGFIGNSICPLVVKRICENYFVE